MSGRFRILIVDDNRALIDALSDILEAKGYEPIAAFDGVEAVEQARRGHFDCILMDVRMPRMGGIDAFRQVRELTPSTPVILMTGYSINGLVEDALSEGALAILRKPLQPVQLLDLVQKVRQNSPVVIADSSPDPSVLQALRDSGYRLAVTNKPGNALAMAEQVDMVLLNAEVSGFSGSDVALFNPFDAKCALILLSGQPIEDSNAFVRAALAKPFKIDSLVSLLERLRKRSVEKSGSDVN